MCNAFSTSARPPGLNRMLPLVAIVQAAAAVSVAWRAVEQLREERLRREQELQHDQAKMGLQLEALDKMLAAHVSLEQARATAFMAAMAVINPTRDPTTVARILDLARDLLDRPLTMPVPDADWRC